jgi:RimJ/RimL family protein N-acetyltransferase
MLYLETDRLILKPHTPANAPAMHAWENDAELLHYSDSEAPGSEPGAVADMERYLREITAEWPRPSIIHYAIHTKPDSELIGYGMIGRIDRHNRQCKLGIVIGDKREWRRGYAGEALEAVVKFCFDTLEMNRIGAEIYEFNSRAVRLFERLGFTREGVVREAVLKNGKFADEYLYGLLRREWAGRLSSSGMPRSSPRPAPDAGR